MGIGIDSVLGYLFKEIGCGKIRLTDILLSFSKSQRDSIDAIVVKNDISTDILATATVDRIMRLSDGSLTSRDVALYLQLRRPEEFLGDLYEFLRATEITLHSKIRAVLTTDFGVEESGWWRKGVPDEGRGDSHLISVLRGRPAGRYASGRPSLVSA